MPVTFPGAEEHHRRRRFPLFLFPSVVHKSLFKLGQGQSDQTNRDELKQIVCWENISNISMEQNHRQQPPI